MVLSTALLCLALNVYHEARGESFKGQVAVADVTMNRSFKTGESVCSIVTAYKQFSWLNDDFHPVWQWQKGRKVVTGEKLDRDWVKRNMPTDHDAWMESIQAARLALYGLAPDVTKGSTYYHAKYVNPAWKKEKVRVAVIGQHVFYVNRKSTEKKSLTFLKLRSMITT